MESQESNKIEVIKPDAIINIKFGRDFYIRLTMVLQQVIENKSVEEMTEAANQIDKKEIKENWIFAYETMLYLIKAAEDYCQQNGMTEWVTPSEQASSEGPQ